MQSVLWSTINDIQKVQLNVSIEPRFTRNKAQMHEAHGMRAHICLLSGGKIQSWGLSWCPLAGVRRVRYTEVSKCIASMVRLIGASAFVHCREVSAIENVRQKRFHYITLWAFNSNPLQLHPPTDAWGGFGQNFFCTSMIFMRSVIMINWWVWLVPDTNWRIWEASLLHCWIYSAIQALPGQTIGLCKSQVLKPRAPILTPN